MALFVSTQQPYTVHVSLLRAWIAVFLCAVLVAYSAAWPVSQAWAGVGDGERVESSTRQSRGGARSDDSEPIRVNVPLDGADLDTSGADLKDAPLVQGGEVIELRRDSSETDSRTADRSAPARIVAPVAEADRQTPQTGAVTTDKTATAHAVFAPFAKVPAALDQRAVQAETLNGVFGEMDRSGDAGDPATTAIGSGTSGRAPLSARLRAALKSPKFNVGKFFTSTATGQASLETFTVGGPALIDEVFGQGKAQSILPDVSIVGYFMMLIGRMTGPVWVNRFGSRGAYIGLLVASLGFAALQTGLIWYSILTLPMLWLTMGGYRYTGSASTLAENGIINSLNKADQDALNRTIAKVGVLTQTVSALIPYASGYLIKWAASVMPLLAISLGLYIFSIGMLAWFKSPEAASEHTERFSLREFLKQLRTSLGRGARVVWSDPVLRGTTIVFALLMALNPVIFSVFSPNYADMLIKLGMAIADDKANIYTTMFAALAVGGIFANLRMARGSKTSDKQQTLAQRNEAARKRMLRWVLGAFVSTVLLGTLAIPIPPLGALIPLPGPLAMLHYITLPAVALSGFGFMLVTASNQLRSFFNMRVGPPADTDSEEVKNQKKQRQNDAYGVFQAIFILSSILALAAFKFPFTGELPFGFKPITAFTGWGGAVPFEIAAGLVLLMGTTALWVRRGIARNSRPVAAGKDSE